MGYHQIIKKRGILIPYFVLLIDHMFFHGVVKDSFLISHGGRQAGKGWEILGSCVAGRVKRLQAS